MRNRLTAENLDPVYAARWQLLAPAFDPAPVDQFPSIEIRARIVQQLSATVVTESVKGPVILENVADASSPD